MQKRYNSSANALELHFFSIKPSISGHCAHGLSQGPVEFGGGSIQSRLGASLQGRLDTEAEQIWTEWREEL